MSLITNKTRFMLKREVSEVTDTYKGPAGELVVDQSGFKMAIQNAVKQGGVPIPGVTRQASTPTILAPLDGSIGVSRQPILMCAPFQGDGEHAATHWQVSRDGSFITVDFLTGDDNSRLTQYPLAAADVTLEPEAVYYVRCRQLSSLGFYTEWSSAKSFTTSRVNEALTYSQRIISQGNEGVGDVLAVSSDGALLVSGEPRHDSSVQNGGRAVAYRRGEDGLFSTEHIMVNPNPTQHDVLFGAAVAVSGNGLVIAVGAPNARSGTGSSAWKDGVVYLYRNLNNFWYMEGFVSSPMAMDGGQFGTSLALNYAGTRLAVGEVTGGVAGNGAIHIFEPINGQWRAKHSASPTTFDLTGTAGFGHVLDFTADGDVLAVGAPGADTVLLYQIDTVLQAAGTFTRAGTVNINRFGESIALSADGHRLLVGAPEYTEGNMVMAGKAFLYEQTNGVWQLIRTIAASDAASHRRYGRRVGVSGDGAVSLVSASKRPLITGGTITDGVGAVDVYIDGDIGWTLRTTLETTAPVLDLEFGTSLALSENGRVAAVGSIKGNNALGDIHIYSL